MRYKHPREWTTDEYKAMLSGTGLPAAPARQCTVAIVGAGMAGLVCASLLHRAKFNVRIYEASQRVGGRIRTLRDEAFSRGLYAEAGAMRIPHSHCLTLDLVEQYGLKDKLIEFPENDSGLVFLNDRHFTRTKYEAGKADFRGGYERRTAAEARSRTMKVFQGRNGKYRTLKTLSTEQRRKLDSMSLGEYLRAFLPMDQGGQVNRPITTHDLTSMAGPYKAQAITADERIGLGDLDLIGLEDGASDLRASFLEVYRDHRIISGTRKYQIKDGMDLLPRSLVDREGISELIRFNSRVATLNRERGGFQIQYENPITHVSGHDFAHYIVLAAPFSALTHVKFGGEVATPETLRAIRNLHYENATKILLEFDSRFWEEDHNIVNGGFTLTDLPIRWVYYPAQKQNPIGSKRGVLLASYTWGEDSLRWAPLRPYERIRFALSQIADLHGEGKRPLSYYENHLVGGTSHSWAEDEFTFGAFAIFDPHQETELFEHAWRPHKGVHFAGEHTSLKHAWIEGAVESGIRAATEVALSEGNL